MEFCWIYNYHTPTLNTQYAFDDTASMYLGYTKVYRPLRVGDYDRTNGSDPAGLEDEKVMFGQLA